jgi:hypothetical protein
MSDFECNRMLKYNIWSFAFEITLLFAVITLLFAVNMGARGSVVG